MLKSLFCAAIFVSQCALAKSSKVFDGAITQYQNAKLVSMSVEKTVKSELLGKETVFKGQIQLSSGKFRWENKEPEKTILIFDGQNLFNIQYPPKDFDGPIQVAKSKIDEKTKNQILISSLLSPDKTKSKFKIAGETKSGTSIDFKLKPEEEDIQIKDLMVRIDLKTKKIQQISYSDDVGNLTKLAFSEIKFQKKNKPEVFKYKIPKGAQVTEL